MNGILLGRLFAMREQLDAIIETLEDEKPVSSCQHPPEKRKYAGETMGGNAFTCQQCGVVVESAESIVQRIVQQ